MVRLRAQRCALTLGYIGICTLFLTLRSLPEFEKIHLSAAVAILQKRKESEAADAAVTDHAEGLWPRSKNYQDIAYDKARVLRQLLFEPEIQDHTFTIYLPHGFAAWYIRPEHDHFTGCIAQNCILSESEKNISNYDAILFRNNVYDSLAKYRHPRQVWVWYSLEAPLHIGPLPIDNETAVNWTATYRYTSDIPTPYGYYLPPELAVRYPHIKDRPPAGSHVLGEAPRRPRRRRNYGRRKSKLVTWFVSNCFTTNKRMQYAKELAVYVDVDIYGYCGNDSCSKNDPKCWGMLDDQYKFYLAFENANCDGYVTEKFFEVALSHDIVPIVMGAPRAFYEAIAPPHSFLHVEDYASPAALAEHLRYLDRNHTAYNAYLAWKDEGGRLVDTRFLCRLCALLNAPPRVSGSSTHHDLNAWWNPTGTCRQRH